MKVNKIIAAVFASAIAASSATVFNSNAVCLVMNSNSPYYQQYIDQFVELDDHGFFLISVQGEYNADVDGSGGITVLDSLEIQKMDAKLS